jgi:hypothetical protein
MKFTQFVEDMGDLSTTQVDKVVQAAPEKKFSINRDRGFKAPPQPKRNTPPKMNNEVHPQVVSKLPDAPLRHIESDVDKLQSAALKKARNHHNQSKSNFRVYEDDVLDEYSDMKDYHESTVSSEIADYNRQLDDDYRNSKSEYEDYFTDDTLPLMQGSSSDDFHKYFDFIYAEEVVSSLPSNPKKKMEAINKYLDELAGDFNEDDIENFEEYKGELINWMINAPDFPTEPDHLDVSMRGDGTAEWLNYSADFYQELNRFMRTGLPYGDKDPEKMRDMYLTIHQMLEYMRNNMENKPGTYYRMTRSNHYEGLKPTTRSRRLSCAIITMNYEIYG